MAGVLYIHFWNPNPVMEGIRVALFFVISGYLITRMLLAARGRATWRTVRNFYGRRLLRLQPALLLMLAVATAFNAEHIRSTLPWHVFQLSNFLFIVRDSWDPWVTTHLWSLNVVEQFYAFWPLIILFLPLRAVWVAALLMIVAAVVYEMSSFANSDTTGIARTVFPVASFDAIGFGVIIALIEACKPNALRFAASSWVGLAALGVLLSPLVLGREFLPFQVYEFVILLALTAIIAGASVGYEGILKWILECPPLRYLGKISYGVYIYHFLILYLLFQVVPGDLIRDPGPMRFLIASTMTILAASVSWHFMEAPIARNKRFLPVAASGGAARSSRS